MSQHCRAAAGFQDHESRSAITCACDSGALGSPHSPYKIRVCWRARAEQPYPPLLRAHPEDKWPSLEDEVEDEDDPPAEAKLPSEDVAA